MSRTNITTHRGWKIQICPTSPGLVLQQTALAHKHELLARLTYKMDWTSPELGKLLRPHKSYVYTVQYTQNNYGTKHQWDWQTIARTRKQIAACRIIQLQLRRACSRVVWIQIMQVFITPFIIVHTFKFHCCPILDYRISHELMKSRQNLTDLGSSTPRIWLDHWYISLLGIKRISQRQTNIWKCCKSLLPYEKWFGLLPYEKWFGLLSEYFASCI
jgi:hypothetical protein